MKKWIAVLCLVLMLTGCAGKTVEKPAEEPAAEEPAAPTVEEPATPINVAADGKEYTCEDIVPQITGFSFQWLSAKKVQEDIEEGKNVMLSPFSLYEDMSMMANGAGGKTLEEILTVFGVDQIEKANGITTYDGGDSLNIANSIWVKDSMGDLSGQFLGKIRPYQADAYSRPFNEQTKEEINAWVSEKTKGMIPELLDKMNPDVVMYLLNAVCFEGEWKEEYQAWQVDPNGQFTNAKGEREETTVLRSGSECLYFSLNEADCLVKHYKGDKLSFVGIRPKDGQTAADFLKGLTGEDYLKAYAEAHQPDEMVVMIPEFKYDYTVNANEDLIDLGIQDAFEDGADFSGILENGNVHISNVIQKTHIELDRSGTKAAAVTEIGTEEAAMEWSEDYEYREVLLDRPFVYAIVDTATGMPVFTGVVNTTAG